MKKREVIRIEDMVKIHANRLILNKINMTVYEGEYYAVYAAPKAGKSVLLNCILSLFSVDKGKVYLLGKEMEKEPEYIKRNVGVVLEKPAVFRELTVKENISYFADMYLQKKSCASEVERAISWMQLKGCRNLYPDKLKKGELRRLDIACGAVHQPRLLVADAPADDLDEDSRKIIFEGLNELHAEGTTILTASSDEKYVGEQAEKIALFDHGRIIEEGTVQSLKAMISLKEILVVRGISLNREQERELQSLLGIGVVEHRNTELVIRNKKGKNQIKGLMDFFRERDIVYEQISIRNPTLADVFFEITGHRVV